MTDYFALLNEPRRPWIDTDLLKQKFLALSAAVHPDRVHNAPIAEREQADRRYAELNTAYQCLKEPRDRLAHLLELESGAKPAGIQRIPAALMDSFMKVGQLCKEADALLAEKSTVTSPLLQVQIFERSQNLTEKLGDLQRQINQINEEAFAELREMNQAWESGAKPLERIEQIYRRLSYHARWSEQIQERVVQLSL